tara:strand:+ start:839 stop:1648 length:810 start_codon:yes stop_codon:yes gene_type:complete
MKITVILISLFFSALSCASATEKVAIITGSSSGLGYELAQLAMKDNMHLVLVDIRPDGSEQLAQQYRRQGGKALVIEADLADPLQRPQVINKTIENFERIDYLFNNAGYSYMTGLADHDMAEAHRLFEVNYWSYVDLAQHALPYMQQQQSGVIINTSSVLGVIPSSPQLSVYAATKHALVGFFQAVDKELAQSGVEVKLVCPGGMKTNILVNAVGKHVDQVQHIDDDWEPPTKVAREIFAEKDNGELLQFPSVAKAMRAKYLQSLASEH